jgi:sugar phosphate isomerase/epimerase
MTNGPKMGVTLFSFTDLYYAHRYTFEELIRKCGALDLGPGLEIVGFQSIRGFPAVSDRFASRFRRLLDDAGLEPSALGANIDSARRAGRLMTHDETVETLEAQIRAAAKLGFRVLRVQFGADADALEGALPLAEASDVRLGMEVHSPHAIQHSTMLKLRERFDALGSPYLGFIPDFGTSMNAVPAGLIKRWREDPGASGELLELTQAAWSRVHRGEASAFEERRNVLQAAAELDAGPGRYYAFLTMTLFGHQAPEAWSEIIHQVVHVHGKFYDLDADDNEPSMSYDTLMRVFAEGGYDGYISSEWEGSIWDETSDAFDVVRRHQNLMRRHLAAGATR